MNAIQFLLKEHETVKKMLTEIANKSHRDETKKKMFDTLSQDLIRHEKMEQEVWYPHFRDNKKIDDIVKHLITEEKSAANTIKELDKIKDQESWEEKFSKFKKDVEHHASEEENKLFPQVEKILTDAELEEIGKEMDEFKKEFKIE